MISQTGVRRKEDESRFLYFVSASHIDRSEEEATYAAGKDVCRTPIMIELTSRDFQQKQFSRNVAGAKR